MRPTGPVRQRGLAAREESAHPLADGGAGQVGLGRDVGLGATLVQDPGHKSTTAFSGQRSVSVHETGLLRTGVLPW